MEVNSSKRPLYSLEQRTAWPCLNYHNCWLSWYRCQSPLLRARCAHRGDHHYDDDPDELLASASRAPLDVACLSGRLQFAASPDLSLALLLIF
jgi:hypothetical protein